VQCSCPLTADVTYWCSAHAHFVVLSRQSANTSFITWRHVLGLHSDTNVYYSLIEAHCEV